MNTEIPQLRIEALDNGCIRLENTECGDSYVVDIHPTHLRYMAEQSGLIRELSASDAELLRAEQSSVAVLRAENLRFKRALEHLRYYAEKLHTNLVTTSRHGREDLTLEVTDALAMINFADYICEEFEDEWAPGHDKSRDVTASHLTQDDAASKPSGNPVGTQRVVATAQMELVA